MDKKEWEENCQPFELDFHSKENYRWDKELFKKAWQRHFFEWCGCKSWYFRDQVVLDIGCGSVPAIDYFEDSVRYYLDPLIDKYIHIPQIVEHWDQEHLARSITGEAETYWQIFYNSCMFINCWNVLDHCYDWRKVIENIVKYARPGCLVSLGTDMAAHTGHAGIDNFEELFIRLADKFEVLKDEPGYWKRDMALLLKKKG